MRGTNRAQGEIENTSKNRTTERIMHRINLFTKSHLVLLQIKNLVNQIRARIIIQLILLLQQHRVRLLRLTSLPLPYCKALQNNLAGVRSDHMGDVVIILERVFDAQLHLHLPQTAPTLLLAVEEASLPHGHHGVVVIELERVEIEKLQQQLADRHRVLLREPTQQVQMLRTVEIGVVHGLLVALDGDLRSTRVPRDWAAIPVGREFLRVRV